MALLPTAAELTERLPRPLRRHRLMTGWMRLTGEDPVQLVRIRDDAFGYADMSDDFQRLIPIEGVYDHDFFRIADALLEDDGRFFDVGAYFGLLSFGLGRVVPPEQLIEFLDEAGHEVCLSREYDLANAGGATHTLAGVAGDGVPRTPTRGHTRPAMTDLLAVPKERLVER